MRYYWSCQMKCGGVTLLPCPPVFESFKDSSKRLECCSLAGPRTLVVKFACRRKFRSQTSDNMERWKSRGGKSQGGEVKKGEDQRRERVRSKKMQVSEKVGKSRFTVFFQ